MKADISEWFDQDEFRRDVNAYLSRQKHTASDLAMYTDMASGVVTKFLHQNYDLTLRTAAALATACDLSLDVYVLTQSQHDQYIDSQFTLRKVVNSTAAADKMDEEMVDEALAPVVKLKLVPKPISFWRQ